MTRIRPDYRGILRLAAKQLSQEKIACSVGSSKKTVNRILRLAKERGLSWTLPDEQTNDATSLPRCSPNRQKSHRRTAICRILSGSIESCNMLESTRSCSGRSIWKNADSRTSWVSSIRSSAITSSWVRNAVRQPCIFITSPVRRLKDRRRPTQNWYTPKLNTAYHELAEYYDTVILPARVRHPKDKPSAEGNVGHASTLLIAALRHEQFFSLADLNAALAEKLEAYNHRPFQKWDGCRLDIFLQEERPYLASFPSCHMKWRTGS